MVYYTKTDIIAFLVTLLALIINSVGIFINQWWETRTGSRHGLFTMVACHREICEISTETSGWITIAQATVLVQFIGLITSLVVHLLNCCEVANRNLLRFVTIVLLGTSCLFAHLHTFILISVYGRLTTAYFEHRPLPVNYAYFLTLPVGLNAISGIMSLGPFLALVVVHTKEKKIVLGFTVKGKTVPRTDSKTDKVTSV